MKLIAEAGGTKIDWVVISQQEKLKFNSTGYNPLQNDSNYLRQILISSFPSKIHTSKISEIEYFGTGCASTLGKERVTKSLSTFFCNANIINVYSDLAAVGKSTFKNSQGIVGILGTGASIGFYKHNDIKLPIPSLGYILGDEGSGAWLGKELIKKTLRKQLPNEIIELLFKKYKTTQEEIIKNTYSTPTSKYVASFAPFIKENIDNVYICNIVLNGFKQYISENIIPLLKLHPNESITISGGIAYNFQDILLKEINEVTTSPVKIIKSPLEGIISSTLLNR